MSAPDYRAPHGDRFADSLSIFLRWTAILLLFGLRHPLHFPYSLDNLLVVQDIEDSIAGDFAIR